MPVRKIELLAPARTAETGIHAINHGADAIYIGPDAFGARQAASNSVEDIHRLVEHAHIYRARVYATVNTVIYPNELKQVEHLCHELYRAGVDALIVQDMALLRLDLPPIELHASTQCDIRTVEKALFLEKAGFSQLVLARELTLQQIRAITSVVTIPVETFVHGALCVSYSGRCSASQLCMGRSANRGNCAQMCRLPYTLSDNSGRILARDKHLLSLHDLNLSDRIELLLDAGVSSFKIEGRLKEASYVKNVVANYRAVIDSVIATNPEKYARSSYGTSRPEFIPDISKSFNRGFTHYFLDDSEPRQIASLLTPKSLGEAVTTPDLNSGDGIAYIDGTGHYTGLRVNRVEGTRILTYGNVRVPEKVELRRTYDRLHTEAVERSNPTRRIFVDIELSDGTATIKDERGLHLSLPMPEPMEGKKNNAKIQEIFSKLGSTAYMLRNYSDNLRNDVAYAPSVLTAFRRRLINELDRLNRITYSYGYRRSEEKHFPYPGRKLRYTDNVANELAASFYREHGVTEIESALEVEAGNKDKKVAMTCRHCILRELNLCLKTNEGKKLRLPLTLRSGPHTFRPVFNCRNCEMQLLIN